MFFNSQPKGKLKIVRFLRIRHVGIGGRQNTIQIKPKIT